MTRELPSLPASTIQIPTERPAGSNPMRFATTILSVKTFMGRVSLEAAAALVVDLAEGFVPAALVVLLVRARVNINAMVVLNTVRHVIIPNPTPVRVAGHARKHAPAAARPELFAPLRVTALTVCAATILLYYALLTMLAAPRRAMVASGMDLPALSPPTAIQAHAASRLECLATAAATALPIPVAPTALTMRAEFALQRLIAARVVLLCLAAWNLHRHR